MPSPSSLWIAVVQILLSVNSMLDGCEITETKEIGACEVLRAQELTRKHTHTHIYIYIYIYIYIVHIIIYTYLEEKNNPPFGIDL